MKIKLITGVLIALTFGFSLRAFPQKTEWGISTFGFFDNQEYKSNNRISQTMAGMWIQPHLGWQLNKKQSLHIGIGGLLEWGAPDLFQKGLVTAYYQYSLPSFKFSLGSFSRDHLRGEYSNAFFSDSIRYYRPNMQGFTFQWGNPHDYFELFLDWTSRQTTTQREQFMAGGAAKYNYKLLFGGMRGYYYHYAKVKDAPANMSIQDYGISNVFIGIDLSKKTSLDSLLFQVGPLAGLERNRGIGDWQLPVGMLAEFRMAWKHVLLEETLYLGDSQQRFGDLGAGAYYWNDAFYRSTSYSRTDIYYKLISNRFAQCNIGATFHLEGGKVSWQQKFILRVQLDNYKIHNKRHFLDRL